ncbi:MAG: L-threonylcarbamoyladenylate synthase [Patescibacteria group bacterium]
MKEIIETIKARGIGVMPTDTMYGIVGSALNKKAVERIYVVRKRTPSKPLIILISKISDLNIFNIKIDTELEKKLKKLWPNKVSVILPCKQKKFEYLHRGTNKLAFRLPKDKKLREFISATGPIVAPSANTEGDRPSKNINQAQKYFGASVDFYMDKGDLPIVPSTIVEIENGETKIIRMGAIKI